MPRLDSNESIPILNCIVAVQNHTRVCFFFFYWGQEVNHFRLCLQTIRWWKFVCLSLRHENDVSILQISCMWAFVPHLENKLCKLCLILIIGKNPDQSLGLLVDSPAKMILSAVPRLFLSTVDVFGKDHMRQLQMFRCLIMGIAGKSRMVFFNPFGHRKMKNKFPPKMWSMNTWTKITLLTRTRTKF